MICSDPGLMIDVIDKADISLVETRQPIEGGMES